MQSNGKKASLYFGYGLMPKNILRSMLEFCSKLKDPEVLEQYRSYVQGLQIVNPDETLNESDLNSMLFMTNQHNWNDVPILYADFPNLVIRQLFERALESAPDFVTSLDLENNQSITNVYEIDLDQATLAYSVGGESYYFDRDLALTLDISSIGDIDTVFFESLERIALFINGHVLK